MFSRVELHIGDPYEGEAPALHIASDDLQNVFHHMGIPEWLRPYFYLRPLSARALGMTSKIVQEGRLSGGQGQGRAFAASRGLARDHG